MKKKYYYLLITILITSCSKKNITIADEIYGPGWIKNNYENIDKNKQIVQIAINREETPLLMQNKNAFRECKLKLIETINKTSLCTINSLVNGAVNKSKEEDSLKIIQKKLEDENQQKLEYYIYQLNIWHNLDKETFVRCAISYNEAKNITIKNILKNTNFINKDLLDSLRINDIFDFCHNNNVQ